MQQEVLKQTGMSIDWIVFDTRLLNVGDVNSENSDICGRSLQKEEDFVQRVVAL